MGLFVITDDQGTATGWRDDHASHRGLPAGAYVRSIREHPTQEEYAYFISDEEDTNNPQWVQDAKSEADDQVSTLPSGWYTGSTAPAAAVFAGEEFYTTDPGVTSVDGATGDVKLNQTDASSLQDAKIVDTDSNGDEVVEQNDGSGEILLEDYIKNNSGDLDEGQILSVVNAGTDGKLYTVLDPANGTFKQSGGAAVFSQDFTTAVSVGTLPADKTFAKGTPLERAIIALSFKYTSPSFSLSLQNANNVVEVGATVSGDAKFDYTANDAGVVPSDNPNTGDRSDDGIRLERNGSLYAPSGSESLQNKPSLPVAEETDFSFLEETDSEQLTSSEGSITYTGKVYYEQLANKKFGVDGRPGPAELADSFTIYWRYRYWYGTDGPDITDGTSSSEVHNFSNTALDVGGSINQNGVDGATTAEIAIENGHSASKLKTVSSGFTNEIDISSLSVGSNDYSNGTMWYREPSVVVADGSTTKTYRVYQWVPDSAFPSDTDLEWVL